MRKLLLSLLAVASIFMTSIAQEENHQECGIQVGPESEAYFQRTAKAWNRFLKTYDATIESRSADYIPVQIHIVRRSDGTGGISVNDINQAIAEANSYYINANIQFFICGDVNYIDNNTYYSFDKSEESALIAGDYVSNVLNIYFMNTVTSGANSLCGYGHFPWIPNDVIVMANSCVLNGSTFVHEIGHYFSLLHTHEPYYGNELVNGSNCSTAGDQLCDTPADPKLSSSNVNTACEYTGTTTDANGDTYVPDPHNMMSYSRKYCRDYFSPDQYARIAFSRQNDRSHLSCGSEYCGSYGLTSNYIYIDEVQLGNINHESGLNNGYGNFTDVSTVLTKGDQQSFRLFPSVMGSAYTAYWRIWVDFNGDNDFTDSGEQVFSGSGAVYATSGLPVNGSFEVPSGAITGPVKMRISMRSGIYPGSCSTSAYGETEDYTVYLEDGYCSGEGGSTTYEWIQRVSLHTLQNNSGADEGYGNYTHLLTNLEKGNSYTLEASPGFASSSYNEFWTAWIDFNQDGDFEDYGEKIMSTTATASDVSATVNVPSGIPTGCTRMRIAMSYGAAADHCDRFSWGEVEDYSIFISEPYCNNSGGNTSYEFIQRVIFKTVDNSLLTTYIVDNNSGNDGGYGDYTNIVIPVQKGLSYPFVAIPGYVGTTYNERWKVWIDFNQNGDFTDTGELIMEAGPTNTSVGGLIHFPFDALEGCTRMRIAMSYSSSFDNCSTFSYGEVEDYTLQVLPMAIGADEEETMVLGELEMPEPTVYPGLTAYRTSEVTIMNMTPNPTSATTQVVFEQEENLPVELRVFSTTGQEILSRPLPADKLINYELDGSMWPEGLYLVQMTNGKQQHTQKLIISKK